MNRTVRVELGPGAIWVGILVTHVAFCLLFSVGTLFLPPAALGAGSLFLAALAFGAIPAVVFGWALGLPLGFLLQPIRNQWWHVGAFGLLGAVITLPFGVFEDPPMLLGTVAMAPAAALGRFSVWRPIRIRNDGRTAARFDGSLPARRLQASNRQGTVEMAHYRRGLSSTPSSSRSGEAAAAAPTPTVAGWSQA